MTLHGYVTAVLTYSTACVSQVLAWLWATVYRMPVWASPWKPWLLLHWGYMELHYVMALLWLRCGQCYSCRISQERGCVMVAVPARREWICLHFLWLLASSSSLLAQALPTEQCRQYEQQDSWHHEQDKQYKHIYVSSNIPIHPSPYPPWYP